MTFIALVVVDEAIDACRKAPVKPTMGLRLALAYLHQISDGDLGCHKDYREVFDDFWEAIRMPDNYRDSEVGYIRSTAATSCLTQICRQIGVPLTVELTVRLRKAREKG